MKEYFLNAQIPTNNSVYLIGSQDVLTELKFPAFVGNEGDLATILGYGISRFTPGVAEEIEEVKIVEAKPKKGKGKKKSAASKKLLAAEKGETKNTDIDLYDEKPFTKNDLIRAFGNDPNLGRKRYLVSFVYQ